MLLINSTIQKSGSNGGDTRNLQQGRQNRQSMQRALVKQWTPPDSAFIWEAAKDNKILKPSHAWFLAAIREEDKIDVAAFVKTGIEILNPIDELEQEPNMPVGHLASMFNAQGPNANCLTACAASSQAIGEARELIRRGDADVMLSGGTHSMIHPFGVTGFNLLTALSTRNEDPQGASRPFERDRDGFVLGEGRGNGRARRTGACQGTWCADLW